MAEGFGFEAYVIEPTIQDVSKETSRGTEKLTSYPNQHVRKVI